MKKNKFLKMIISGLLVLSTVFTATACGGGDELGDSSKVNVVVWNYDGGVGHEWLSDAEARFEAAKASTVYKGAGVDGQDLTGVDIVVYNTKDDPINTLSTKSETIFFLQNVRYHQLLNENRFSDITDIVTGTLADDKKSIADKMSPELKSFLQDDGKYYALPHYQSFDGITYNKTLFDEKGFYFAANEEDYKSTNKSDYAYGFINTSKPNPKKSCGPNGEFGDYDDGLPSSIEEFKRLCNYITARGNDAFIWYKGNSGYNYQNKLVNALWASLEGYEGAMSQFTFNTGDIETKIVTDTNTLATKSVKIDDTNAWEIYQQESRYHALDFANFVFTGEGKSGKMRHDYTTMTIVSQTEVQKTFLKDDVAMLLEGTYWENEATTAGVFKDETLKNVETAVMPLPIKATGTVTEGEGREPVLIDTLDSYAFINKNVYDTNTSKAEAVLQVAKEFLQFCYTDESLAKFTEKSGVTKNLTYGTAPNLANATNFRNSVWNIKAEADNKCVTPVSNHSKFINNPATFNMTITNIWTSDKYVSPYAAFVEGNKSVKEVFEGMAKNKTWWDGLAG